MKDSRTRKMLLVALSAFTALVGLCAVAQAADMIVIGTSSGEVFGRSEYDLATHIPSSYVNFGSSMPIGKLAGDDGLVVIGVNASGSANVFTRPVNNLSANLSTLTLGTTNSAITAMGMRGSGTVLVGQTAPDGSYWSGTFVRTVADLNQTPGDYLGGSVPAPGDGWNWGLGVTGISAMANGNFVVGTDNGMVTVRESTDIFLPAIGVTNWHVNLGSPLVGVAGIGNNYALALQNGFVGAQPGNDCYAWVSYVNYGMTATALLSLGDGRIAVGFDTGFVDIRNIADLTVSLGVSAWFGAPIGALAVTSDGNVAVASGNLVFVRKSTDLTATPMGYIGSDGLNFGSPVTALAAIVPEPSSVAALIGGLGGLLAFRRRR